MKNVCYIFGAGEFYYHEDYVNVSEGDLVIAADGGYNYVKQIGLVPDILIGDFDSLESDSLESDSLDIVPVRAINNRPYEIVRPNEIIRLDKVKDITDTNAAIAHGYEAGYREFRIFGGTGGRLDHTLANIQTAADLSTKEAACYLYDKGSVITAITNSVRAITNNVRAIINRPNDAAVRAINNRPYPPLSAPNRPHGRISVFAHSDIAEGVTIKGCKYTLSDAVLSNKFPLGVSNEFISGETASVEVKNGTLIIIYDI
jgi:thiamine pyrophosphokinase